MTIDKTKTGLIGALILLAIFGCNITIGGGNITIIKNKQP